MINTLYWIDRLDIIHDWLLIFIFMSVAFLYISIVVKQLNKKDLSKCFNGLIKYYIISIIVMILLTFMILTKKETLKYKRLEKIENALNNRNNTDKQIEQIINDKAKVSKCK